MINAVGSPRVVINGTALDFLAESFMAGDPHTGGGFAIVNGLRLRRCRARWSRSDLPYPGSNLLSLASGGAIYVRDPHRTLVDEQLNGGAYRPLARRRLETDLPYLEENQRLFGIRIEQRSADGRRRSALAGRGVSQGDAAQRRRDRGRDGRNGRIDDDRIAIQWNGSELLADRGRTPQRHARQRVLPVPQVHHRLPDRPRHGLAAQPDHAAGASGGRGRGARSRRRSGCAPRARPAPRAARRASTSRP